MKKNQIITVVFALVIILSGVLYYEIVDLENGQIVQENEVVNNEQNINFEINDDEQEVVNSALKEENKTQVVVNNGSLPKDLSI